MKITIQFLTFIWFFLCFSTFVSAQTVITCHSNFQRSISIIQPSHSDKIDSLNVPFNTHYTIYEIAIVNTSQHTQNLILSIDNPNIHAVFVHEIDSEETLVKTRNADIKKVFRTLTFSTPITIGVQSYPKTFRIMVAQNTKSSELQIRLSERNFFSQIFSRNVFTIGVYFGLLLIICVYSFLSFFSLKQTYFLWFSLLVFLLGVKVSIRTGIFLYTTQLNHPDIDTFISTLIFVVFILFVQVLFNIKSRFPTLNKVLIAIVLGRILLNALLFVFSSFNWENTEIYSRIGLLFALFIAIYTSLQQNQRSTWFNVAKISGFSFLILAGLLGSFFDLGIILINYTTLGLWLALVLTQILFFLWSISIRVNSIANERLLLGEKMQETKKSLINAYVTGVKTEKLHISKELQVLVLDEIESIKKDTKTPLNKDFNQNLMGIENDIKTISDELSLKTQAIFITDIKHLINQHKRPEVAFHFKSVNCVTELPPSTQKQLFRIIQEAIQNIEKYSQATEIKIQFHQRSNVLFMSIEDNGIGFDPSKKTAGIGLTNMEDRVQNMGGKFEINTSPGQGVSILISIPIKNE